eukprot:TRINITY_DN5321_c0_g1_i1.p1 TRINITY_DN5321_c0_g1~~TRINITY_DN5321_c0_g1_i1.p1  ORF type:complete len:241 (-),score=34.38 TRINITY_DN5321_c0_g1_i1:107-829(-)
MSLSETTKIDVAHREVVLHNPRRLWYYFPMGEDKITVSPVDDDEVNVEIVKSHGLCCCSCYTTEDEFTITKQSLISRRPAKFCPFGWWSIAYVVLMILWTFTLAFLLHLIPSMIITPEVVLGSPENHQALGMVWGVIWAVLVLIHPFLRPARLVVRPDPYAGEKTHSFAVSRTLASEFSRALHSMDMDAISIVAYKAKSDFEANKGPLWIFWIFFGCLLIIGGISAILIKNCQDAGGCQY